MKSSEQKPPKPEAGTRSEADAALIEQGKQWFAEARAQTASDEAEIAAWVRRNTSRDQENDADGLPTTFDGGDVSGGE